MITNSTGFLGVQPAAPASWEIVTKPKVIISTTQIPTTTVLNNVFIGPPFLLDGYP
jgi:hypothetical protein